MGAISLPQGYARALNECIKGQFQAPELWNSSFSLPVEINYGFILCLGWSIVNGGEKKGKEED